MPTFHGNLGEVYRVLGLYAKAIACCRRALEIYPVYPEALNTLGASLNEQHKLEEAEASLRRAIDFKPNFAEAHANLGNLLHARERHEEAVGAYERALSHNPRLAGVRMALGNALRSLGKVEEAIACYREAHRGIASSSRILARPGSSGAFGGGGTARRVPLLWSDIESRASSSSGVRPSAFATTVRWESSETIN